MITSTSITLLLPLNKHIRQVSHWVRSENTEQCVMKANVAEQKILQQARLWLLCRMMHDVGQILKSDFLHLAWLMMELQCSCLPLPATFLLGKCSPVSVRLHVGWQKLNWTSQILSIYLETQYFTQREIKYEYSHRNFSTMSRSVWSFSGLAGPR